MASGLVPPVLWVILVVGAAVVVAGVAFFADRREPGFTQAAMMVAIVVIVFSGLLMVRFLDRPYEDRSGSVKPTAMISALTQMETDRQRSPGPIRC